MPAAPPSTLDPTLPPPPHPFAGLLKDRAPPFNGNEERFSQRFSSFHHVVTTPEPLCFTDYTTSTDVANFTPLALLNLAVEAFEVVSWA